jgi:5'-nucleotidase
LLVLAALSAAAPASAELTIVAFSDYHSHAVPFYSEGARDQGGIARGIAFLKAARARPGTLVLSGGDMLNKTTPAWSDEYGCVEWPWLDGLVDAMALGNHDLDYGAQSFERCRAQVSFPILSANLVRDDGTPFLTAGGKAYIVREALGVRIGIFAVASPDVQNLIRKEDLPPGTRWMDAAQAARSIVKTLREVEHVNAVVLMGHEQREEDLALARDVPGIDLILGTHSHHRAELQKLPGTSTWFISPFQYLAYVSETRLGFEAGKLVHVSGELVKLDASRPEDGETAERVARLQKELEAKHPERFRVLGRATLELSDAHLVDGESLIGDWATELLRSAAGAHAFFATASSFRGALPPGDVTLEGLMTAMPYKNQIVVADMTGKQLLAWLALSASRLGSDGFSQQSGVRYTIRGGQPAAIEVLLDPADPAKGDAALDPEASYRIATTDYQAFVASGYKDLFAGARHIVKTGLDVHELLSGALRRGEVKAALDGRIRVETR